MIPSEQCASRQLHPAGQTCDEEVTMKKALIPLAALLSLAALSNAHAASGEELFKSKPCGACHSVQAKLVGPALKDVAAKNAGVDGAADVLAGHIKNGSTGVWGAMPMPPNPVTEEEAKTLAEWVLTLK
jgi:cytochrome c